ncbi:MAG TPA: type II secretion system F family protein [Phycisphaerae bacterium]|nr:type II secretion system F family protein [Phycisphaerae bacterium]
MTTFSYRAVSTKGQKSNGTLTADNRAAAIASLMQKGLHPLEISEEKAGAAKRAQAVGRAGRVPQKLVEAFTRDLANLLAGGVPLARALNLLRRESSNPAAKHLWGEIHDEVVQGTALADAMAKFPKSFSSVYVAMVKAGEQGGFLEVVLNQIAEFRSREADLKGKVKAAMVYPCVLAVLAVGVIIFLLTFFIPRFTGIFASFGGQLPALTLAIIAASHIVQHDAPVVAGVIIVLVIVLKRMAATESGRRTIEKAMLKAPLLGQVVAHFALVRFCRMLGTLVGSGVPLVSSLRTSRDAIGNQTLADTVNKAIDEVQRGEALSKAFASSPELFPPSVVEMVAVAEETGRLDKELMRLSVTFEQELDRKLRILVSLAEPIMLFLMAAFIGTVVIGMLLPIFSLQDAMK